MTVLGCNAQLGVRDHPVHGNRHADREREKNDLDDSIVGRSASKELVRLDWKHSPYVWTDAICTPPSHCLSLWPLAMPPTTQTGQ